MTVSELPDKDAKPLPSKTNFYCNKHRSGIDQRTAHLKICRNLFRTYNQKHNEVIETHIQKKICYFCEMLKFPKDEKIEFNNVPSWDIVLMAISIFFAIVGIGIMLQWIFS